MEKRVRQLIYDDISKERARQITKWGDQGDHTWFKWLAILTEEVGEVSEVMLQLDGAVDPLFVRQRVVWLRRELTQVAAVSVACLELLGGPE